jgi:hypothetical protein
VILVRRLIELRVANQPLAELPAVLGGLRTDAENRDVILFIPAVFIDKGRNLRPAPGSPLAPIEKYNRRRRRLERCRKRDGFSIDIFQIGLGKLCAD